MRQESAGEVNVKSEVELKVKPKLKQKLLIRRVAIFNQVDWHGMRMVVVDVAA